MQCGDAMARAELSRCCWNEVGNAARCVRVLRHGLQPGAGLGLCKGKLELSHSLWRASLAHSLHRSMHGTRRTLMSGLLRAGCWQLGRWGISAGRRLAACHWAWLIREPPEIDVRRNLTRKRGHSTLRLGLISTPRHCYCGNQTIEEKAPVLFIRHQLFLFFVRISALDFFILQHTHAHKRPLAEALQSTVRPSDPDTLEPSKPA
jgi:hypothetical protein